METEVILNDLLALDRTRVQHGLDEAVGDTYLCRTNSIYSNIRRAAVEFGYEFSCREPGLLQDYLIFPLIVLDRIVSGGVVPYIDNRSALERLCRLADGVRIPAVFLSNNLRRNFTLHESAHCVAHRILEGDAADFIEAGGRERTVVASILAEAFANTVETLAAAAGSSSSNPIAYALNSHMRFIPARRRLLERAQQELGLHTTFTLLFCAYFEANLTGEEASNDTYARILEAADVALNPEPEPEILAGLFTIGFDLDEGFRRTTVPTYFRLMQCSAEYIGLSANAWLGKPRNGEAVRAIVRVLQDIALGDAACGSIEPLYGMTTP